MHKSFFTKKINLFQIFFYLLITFIMILEYKWFFLPSNFDSFIIKFNTDDQSAFIVLVIILSLFILIAIGILNNKKFKVKKYKFFNYVIFIVLLFIAEIIYSIMKYPLENHYRMISSNLFYLVVLLYFVLKVFIDKYKKGFNYFINIFSIFNIIFCFLMISASIIYSKTGEVILNFYMYELMERNNSLRVYSGGGIISVSFLVSIGIFLFSKNSNFRVMHFINISLSLLTIIFVTQSRSLILTLVLILIISFLIYFSTKKILLTDILLMFICFILVLVMFFKLDIIQRLNFSTNEVSYTNRLYAYSYFFEIGCTNFLGIGLLTDYNPIYATILHGPDKIAYISDVGLIGMFGKLGILSVIWYIALVIKYILIYNNLKDRAERFIPLLFSIFLIISSLTQNFVNYFGILLIPVSMVVSEYFDDRRCEL